MPMTAYTTIAPTWESFVVGGGVNGGRGVGVTVGEGSESWNGEYMFVFVF